MAHKSKKLSFMKDVVEHATDGRVKQTSVRTDDVHSTIFHVWLPKAQFEAVWAEAEFSGYNESGIPNLQVFADEEISPRATVAISVWMK